MTRIANNPGAPETQNRHQAVPPKGRTHKGRQGDNFGVGVSERTVTHVDDEIRSARQGGHDIRTAGNKDT